MKLLSRYNRVNITATILAFLVGSAGFYFVLNYILVRQLDRSLRVEEQEIVTYVNKNGRLPEIHDTRHQWIETSRTTTPIIHPKPFSTEAFNKLEDENEPIRRYIFTVAVRGELFQVTVSQSKTETEDLLRLIILVTFSMIALILLSNYLVNRKLVSRLWKPFYRSIKRISEYQVSGREPLQLPSERIDEINLLNQVLNSMTDRIHHDYLSLKTFTENASHEMQTPLAVIRSKTESAVQQAEGNEKLLQSLLSIEDATIKLSRLNQSLLLLTRIGNRQFITGESVDISAALRNKLSETEDIFASKGITIKSSIADVVLPFHQHLAEILISNLFTNLIRYTPEGGSAEIILTQEGLIVQNTASGGPLDAGKIFQRFYKGEQSSESTGLGLAIVQEICTLAGFTIGYRFAADNHVFVIRFSS